MRPSHIFSVLETEFLATCARDSGAQPLSSAHEDGALSRASKHTPVMLWGPPGVGKSQIVAQVAAKHNANLIDIRLSQMEPTDLRGIPFRAGERVEWSIPNLLPEAARHGARGILFLDEITSAPPTVTAAAYQLILDRRLGDYRVPPQWAIFAAGNRQGDRGVTYHMAAPLANRFTHYEIEADLDDWIAWAHHQDIDERLIAFLRFRPELLFEFKPSVNPIAFPSPRTWEYADRALKKFARQPALLADALQGAVGAAAGAELKAFLDHLAEMPDIDAILQGKLLRAPEAIDLQYAVASALVRRCVALRHAPDAQRYLNNVLRYARALPQRELGVMLVTDLQHSIGAPLVGLAEFAHWAESVADVMLTSSAR
jgi:MoxR-like ATPase